jgi:hypothetical protein
MDLDLHIAVDNIVLLPKLGTDTPTATQTALQGTPYNEPGSYMIYKCVSFVPGGSLTGARRVDFCLNTVVVNANRTMRFNVSWKVFYDQKGFLKMESYANDDSVFLTDNLKNEYRHTQVGGCAANGYVFVGQSNCGGWFVFPAAKTGATSFQLMDFRYGVSIKDIILVPKNQ